jgi:Subtilase family
MKRLPLITVLILLLLFALAIFFYFSLGSQPKIVGEEDPDHIPNSELELTIKNNPQYASYVYVSGVGYVLKDRRIVLLVEKDSSDAQQAEAIKNVEKDLESYWKWRILTGDRKIEDLTSKTNQTFSDKKIGKEGTGEQIPRKGIFSRILDVFKVADAVIVIQDKAKKCDCDNDLLLLSGPDLHLISTTLNPDGPGAALGNHTDESSINHGTDYTKLSYHSTFKLPQKEPQGGDGKSASFLVGIIDSGINFGEQPRPAKGTMFENEVFITPRMESSLNYNFIMNSSEIIDSVTHGTNIARIIVKNTSSDKVKIVGLKTFDKNKVGNLYDNLCAVLYAIKHDMKIVNASWGASMKASIPVFEEVIRRAKTANMPVICSAGNDKIDIDLNPCFPACYADHSELGNHVITVTSKYDSICQNFSSSGKKIDLAYKTDSMCRHPIPDATGAMGIIFYPGTSYAAPYITADVINYLLLHPSGFSKSGYISSIPVGSDIKKY